MASKKLLFYTLALLTGCISMSKDEQTRDLLSCPNLDQSLKNSLETPFFSRGNWPDQTWWHMFDSIELNTLIETALHHNPDLQSIEKRVEEAKKQALVARSKLFPLLSFDASDSWSYLSKHGLLRALKPDLEQRASVIDLSLSFTYEFDFWSKLKNQFCAAIGRQKAEEAAAAQTKIIVESAVAQAFFALKTHLQKQDLVQQLTFVRKKSFALQQLLFNHALNSKLPLYSEEKRLLESEKMVDEIESQVATNRHLLNILTGNSPDAWLAIDATLPTLPATLAIPENLSLNLLSRRPDLMAQIWRVEALAHEVGAARAEYFPNINLSTLLGLESVNYNTFFQAGSFTADVNPAVNLPLFTAGGIQAKIDSKRAQFSAAIFDYNELLLQSAQEVADLLVLAKSTFNQQAKQTKIIQCACARTELMQLREQNGLDNALQVYALEEEWLENKIANVDLVYGQYVAAIKLIKALGGGYTAELVPLKKEAL